MWTLTLCLSTFLGICTARPEFEFPDRATCEEERQEALKFLGSGGYAVCAPKKPEPKQSRKLT